MRTRAYEKRESGKQPLMIHRKKRASAASLMQACYLAVIKPISGCVRIACSGLMITSLLQVVNRLAQVDCKDVLADTLYYGHL